MRVLHVHSGNLFGGVESLLLALVRGRQLQPGLEHEFALCFEGRLSAELREAGAAVHLLGPARVSRPWTLLAARARLWRLLERGGYGAALCHSAWPQALLSPAARWAGTPLVFFLHDAVSGRHWLERWASANPPDLAVCNSEFTRGQLANLYPAARAVVVRPPVPAPPPLPPSERAALRAELGVAEGEVVVAQVGRLEPLKGQRLHLQALATLKDVPGWVCWMVGGAQRPFEEAFLAELKALAGAQGLSGRVRFLGQRTDVRRLLAAADVYCQPNVGPESFGITLVEALYAGLPVVTTDLGGAREVVDGAVGARVRPDAGEVASALRRLLTDAGERRRLGARGPERARALSDPAARLLELAEALGTLGPARAAA